MQENNHIALFVPDGTGIKNYLYSSIFKNTNVQLSLLHNFDDDTLIEIRKHIEITNEIKLPAYKETVKEKFLREVIHAARLNYNKDQTGNVTILEFKKTNHTTTKLKLFYKAIEFYAKRIKTYKQILKLEAKYEKMLLENTCYNEALSILEKENFTTLFCTHQRAIKGASYFLAAKNLGIRTTTVIYSWDNLPKARLALRADKYLVWSALMKSQLAQFYPEIPEENIYVTGTPQFEFYGNKENIITKEEFYTTHNLDSAKKIICFSGDDELTSPYDPIYLDNLATELTRYNKHNEYQIVFRRCPVDLSGRYDWVLKKHPELIKDMPPKWNFNSTIWTAVYPLYEDVKLLVSLAYYADMVINLGSTMAFDFGMFNKPCIYIAYDPVETPITSVKTIYNFEHFKSMPSEDAIFWLRTPSEIINILGMIKNNQQTKITDWMHIINEHPLNSSVHIKKVIRI